MDRKELLRKLETMLDAAEHAKTFGSIEIELRNGQPQLIRTVTTELITCQGNKAHDNRTHR